MELENTIDKYNSMKLSELVGNKKYSVKPALELILYQAKEMSNKPQCRQGTERASFSAWNNRYPDYHDCCTVWGS